MPRVVPIRWVDGRIEILDQTLLPRRETYIRCRTVRQVADAIRSMRVRGAPLIGIAAAYAMALSKNPRRDAQILIRARPTAVNLSWAVMQMLPDPTLAEAKRIHREDRNMCDRIARHGARLFRRGAPALTICNTGALATGGVGTAYGVLRRARANVFALETRPAWQGARLTMWEAKKNRLPATLVADGAAGSILREGRVRVVITGADRIARNGDTANKIGTYSLAVLAREDRVPFYVAAPSSTFDLSLRTGRDIPIEERDPAELLTAAPHGVQAFNPAFDVTPARLITAFITDRGVLRPPFHPSLR